MILVLLGPPGVGKGTQGTRISVHYEIPTISTGAMFRDAMARGTELGRILQRYKIEQGEYVPDSIVLGAVRTRISEPDCAKGFLLDGFPRTIQQAEGLDTMLQEMERVLVGSLNLCAPVQELVERFSGRRVCPVDGSTYHLTNQPPHQPGLCDTCHRELVRREDDAPAVVQRRLEVYEEKTAPLIEYYRAKGIIQDIQAMAEPETVFARVVAAISRLKTMSNQ